MRRCPHCDGRRTILSDFNWSLITCPLCQGAGKVAGRPVPVLAARSVHTPLGYVAEIMRGRRLPAAFAN